MTPGGGSPPGGRIRQDKKKSGDPRVSAPFFVSGKAGRYASSKLSALTPQDVAAAIVTDNAAAFDRVPGLGRKTAQRLLLELKERVNVTDMLGASAAVEGASNMRAEAVAALVNLGYDGLSASRAVTAVKDADSVETLITQALKGLAK